MSNEHGTEAQRILAYGKEVAERLTREFVGSDSSKLQAFSRGFNSIHWDSPVVKFDGGNPNLKLSPTHNKIPLRVRILDWLIKTLESWR